MSLKITISGPPKSGKTHLALLLEELISQHAKLGISTLLEDDSPALATIRDDLFPSGVNSETSIPVLHGAQVTISTSPDPSAELDRVVTALGEFRTHAEAPSNAVERLIGTLDRLGTAMRGYQQPGESLAGAVNRLHNDFDSLVRNVRAAQERSADPQIEPISATWARKLSDSKSEVALRKEIAEAAKCGRYFVRGRGIPRSSPVFESLREAGFVVELLPEDHYKITW